MTIVPTIPAEALELALAEPRKFHPVASAHFDTVQMMRAPNGSSEGETIVRHHVTIQISAAYGAPKLFASGHREYIQPGNATGVADPASLWSDGDRDRVRAWHVRVLEANSTAS
jgi:hypothetical protein